MARQTLQIQELQGYKYVLDQDLTLETPILGYEDRIEIRGKVYVELQASGNLIIYSGYAWDGVSGWREDDKTIFPSLIHDAFYQLMAQEGSQLPISRAKKAVNEYFQFLLKRNGVSRWKRRMFQYFTFLNNPSTRYRDTHRQLEYRDK